ncbi:AAA family ATPase [Desulfovibrio inopinatus]|uniref:AAA family ATPase n=1 Tax=Desulfovibrio inopinatus TaxID=102109 RepID=UPI00040353CD|nr:AAA family ATPase [Desulfovibrio inopinatus]
MLKTTDTSDIQMAPNARGQSGDDNKVIVICPHCKKRHIIEASKIPQKPTSAICKNCHRRFPLRVSETTDAATPPVATSVPPMARRPGVFPKPTTSPPAPQAKADVDPTPQSPEEPVFRMPRESLVPDDGEPTSSAPTTSREARSYWTRKIGIIISKGGVGKTTTAVNLAAAMARIGHNTLLIDTDTQGQSAYALGIKPKYGLAELLADGADPNSVLTQARDNLWLLAGGKSLAGVKRIIDRKDFGGEMTLKESLAPYDGRFKFVIVDSSPGWDPLTVNVLFYVHEVLTPVSLEVMSLQGLSEFLKSLSAISRYNKDVALKYILPTFMDRRVRHPYELYKELVKVYPEYLCDPIRYNVKLSEAPARGQSIFEYAPGSPGAEDYERLAWHIINAGMDMQDNDVTEPPLQRSRPTAR